MNTYETKVAKFGGTSLATPENIRRVVDIVSADPARRIIVVSAPGKRFKGDTKVTDLLITIAQKRGEGKSYSIEFFELTKRFPKSLSPELLRLHRQIHESSPEFIISRGEYLMALHLSRELGFKFAEILQTKSEDKLEIDMVASRRNLAKFRGEQIVVPGFYARTPSGKVLTFSRGGSDITGAILANLANATEYENFTDVDGIYDRDPNKYTDAKKFCDLTYAQAAKLSKDGAQVLHHKVFKFVARKRIPIHLKSTFEPEKRGTIICDEPN